MSSNATEGGAGRFEKTAPDARAAPPEAHESLISRKTVEEVPLTGLSSSPSGTRTATFLIQMSDKTGMSGATATNTLSVTAQVIVVPEPGALVLAAAGVGLAAAWARRRRRT